MMTYHYWALLSMGLNAFFVVAFYTASLGNRGWPIWLKSIIPDSLLPSPFSVMWMLPAVAWGIMIVFLTCTRKRFPPGQPVPRSTRILRVAGTLFCAAAVVGTIGVSFVWRLVYGIVSR